MDIITAITALISALLGGGVAKFLFIKEDKQEKQINNDGAIYQQYENLIKFTQSEVDRVRESNERHREKEELLQEENSQLKKIIDEQNTELAILRLTKCEVRACANRIPPSNY